MYRARLRGTEMSNSITIQIDLSGEGFASEPVAELQYLFEQAIAAFDKTPVDNSIETSLVDSEGNNVGNVSINRSAK
jgi:hypothetical protein